MMLLRRSLALVCLVLLFIFCVSNGDSISVRFLTWESLELPVFLLLIFAFLTGVVLALIGQSLRSVSRPMGRQSQKDQKLERKRQKEAVKMKAMNDPVDAERRSNESATTNTEGEK